KRLAPFTRGHMAARSTEQRLNSRCELHAPSISQSVASEARNIGLHLVDLDLDDTAHLQPLATGYFLPPGGDLRNERRIDAVHRTVAVEILVRFTELELQPR